MQKSILKLSGALLLSGFLAFGGYSASVFADVMCPAAPDGTSLSAIKYGDTDKNGNTVTCSSTDNQNCELCCPTPDGTGYNCAPPPPPPSESE